MIIILQLMGELEKFDPSPNCGVFGNVSFLGTWTWASQQEAELENKTAQGYAHITFKKNLSRKFFVRLLKSQGYTHTQSHLPRSSSPGDWQRGKKHSWTLPCFQFHSGRRQGLVSNVHEKTTAFERYSLTVMAELHFLSLGSWKTQWKTGTLTST